MTVPEIMTDLKAHGSESIKKILVKHGVKEPFFGVKVEHLKVIQKKIKKDYQLAKDLYATGNADAMYLAGLIADDEKMTMAGLHTGVEKAISNKISEYTVDDAGKIIACELELANGNGSAQLSSEQILTFGKDVIIVVEQDLA